MNTLQSHFNHQREVFESQLKREITDYASIKDMKFSEDHIKNVLATYTYLRKKQIEEADSDSSEDIVWK